MSALHRYHREQRRMQSAQWSWDNAAPPEDTEEWEQCFQCHGDGCENCDHKGGYVGSECMTKSEWEQRP